MTKNQRSFPSFCKTYYTLFPLHRKWVSHRHREQVQLYDSLELSYYCQNQDAAHNSCKQNRSNHSKYSTPQMSPYIRVGQRYKIPNGHNHRTAKLEKKIESKNGMPTKSHSTIKYKLQKMISCSLSDRMTDFLPKSGMRQIFFSQFLFKVTFQTRHL